MIVIVIVIVIVIDSDSDSDNDNISVRDSEILFDNISEKELENSLVSDSNTEEYSKSCNKPKSCNENKKLNKDENLDYKEVFNEKNCSILPPHRVYDCEINLKDNSTLFYGPLYPLTELGREELKKQLKELLDKGFI